MFEPTEDEEYLYTASLLVKDSFLNYYDSTDPEIQIWPIETGEITHPMIRSKVFGDKYSARNWLYRLIKTAYSNGAKFEDLVVHPLRGLSCEGHRVKRNVANSLWGKFLPDDQMKFMANDNDVEFSLSLSKMIIKSENSEPRFLLDNLLDSSNDYMNRMVGGKYVLAVKGPAERPFRLEENTDPKKMMESINNLTSEAFDFKGYTIPANSTVDLKTTSYRFVEVIEGYSSVVFIFRNQKDYFTIGLDTKSGQWVDDFVTLNPAAGTVSSEEIALHKLSVKYLAAIILHDFWVTEFKERNKVWNIERKHPFLLKTPWAKVDSDGRTNIYLPRIKFHYNQEQASANLNGEEVFSIKDGVFQKRFFGRSAHPRDLTKGNRNPNPEQVLLANEYGIKVPRGFTFVRPSNRSNDQAIRDDIKIKNTFYISRSALQSLFNVEVFDTQVEIKWLKFENDVMQFCKNELGLVPLPRKIRKRGDGGIDLLMIQKKSGRILYWAIQCKCWSRNRVVGISILRELFSAGLWADELQDDQKKNLRYMIITTSKFSTDKNFIEQAYQNNVILLDGESFLNRLIPTEFAG